MDNRKIICIRCPRGCEVDTTVDGYSVVQIKGNHCKLGIEYVENEFFSPVRIVTTTVKVKNGEYPLAPVWTEKPILKNKIFDLIKDLKNIELTAPVDIDTIVLKNIFNSGVNVITSSKINSLNKKNN